jgi:hypothetical protein
MKSTHFWKWDIWGYHSTIIENWILLGCYAVLLGKHFLTFQRITVTSLFLDCLTVKMKAHQFFKVSGTTHPVTWHYNPEEVNCLEIKWYT